MNSKKLCKICTEYSVEEKCENMDSCELQKILLENKKLKKRNEELKKKLKVADEARIKESWEKYPDMMGK